MAYTGVWILPAAFIVTLAVLYHTADGSGETFVSKGCFGSAGACLHHNLTCSNTSRVAIEMAIYGHKTWVNCTTGVIDCNDPCCEYLPDQDCFDVFIAKDIIDVYRNCSAHECHFRTPRLVKSCSVGSTPFQAVSSYSVVRYECTDESSIIPMCSTPTTVSGTSVSVLYDPSQYKETNDICWCTMTKPSFASVNIEGIDVRLGNSSKCGILDVFGNFVNQQHYCNSSALWPNLTLAQTNDQYSVLRLTGLPELVWIRYTSTDMMSVTCSINAQHTTTTTTTSTTTLAPTTTTTTPIPTSSTTPIQTTTTTFVPTTTTPLTTTTTTPIPTTTTPRTTTTTTPIPTTTTPRATTTTTSIPTTTTPRATTTTTPVPTTTTPRTTTTTTPIPTTSTPLTTTTTTPVPTTSIPRTTTTTTPIPATTPPLRTPMTTPVPTTTTSSTTTTVIPTTPITTTPVPTTTTTTTIRQSPTTTRQPTTTPPTTTQASTVAQSTTTLAPTTTPISQLTSSGSPVDPGVSDGQAIGPKPDPYTRVDSGLIIGLVVGLVFLSMLATCLGFLKWKHKKAKRANFDESVYNKNIYNQHYKKIRSPYPSISYSTRIYDDVKLPDRLPGDESENYYTTINGISNKLKPSIKRPHSSIYANGNIAKINAGKDDLKEIKPENLEVTRM